MAVRLSSHMLLIRNHRGFMVIGGRVVMFWRQAAKSGSSITCLSQCYHSNHVQNMLASYSIVLYAAENVYSPTTAVIKGQGFSDNKQLNSKNKKKRVQRHLLCRFKCSLDPLGSSPQKKSTLQSKRKKKTNNWNKVFNDQN